MTDSPPEPFKEGPVALAGKQTRKAAYIYRGEGTGLFQRCCWDFGQFLSKIISSVLFRLRVQGTENIPKSGPVLMITNHQSFLDPWLIGIKLRRQVHFMARDTLFKGGFLGWLMEILNSYPVKRGAADLQAIRITIERLDDARLVNIFPEGTRSMDGSISPLAPGLTLILHRAPAALQIVPVAIEGAFEAWPRRNKLPHPHPIRIAYGKPIPAAELKGMKPEEIALRLRLRLVELQEQLHSPHAAESRRRFDEDAAKPAEPSRRRGR